jgi:hypothetical protein
VTYAVYMCLCRRKKIGNALQKRSEQAFMPSNKDAVPCHNGKPPFIITFRAYSMLSEDVPQHRECSDALTSYGVYYKKRHNIEGTFAVCTAR